MSAAKLWAFRVMMCVVFPAIAIWTLAVETLAGLRSAWLAVRCDAEDFRRMWREGPPL